MTTCTLARQACRSLAAGLPHACRRPACGLRPDAGLRPPAGLPAAFDSTYGLPLAALSFHIDMHGFAKMQG